MLLYTPKLSFGVLSESESVSGFRKKPGLCGVKVRRLIRTEPEVFFYFPKCFPLSISM